MCQRQSRGAKHRVLFVESFDFFCVDDASFASAAFHLTIHSFSPRWRKGVNQFTDRTQEEFEQQALGISRPMLYTQNVERASYVSSSVSNLPLNKDWRDEDVISTVKDQGRCGSCWTFSAMETLESMWALSTGGGLC